MRKCGHLFDAAPRIVRALTSDMVSTSRVQIFTVDQAKEACGDARDQGDTSECVWFAGCRALDLAARAAGIVQPWFSSQFGYKLTRAIMRDNWTTPLVDDGCPPGIASIVKSGWGLIPESAEPFDPASINDPPDIMKIVQAASHKQTGEYAIVGDRMNGIRAALNAGHFPALAVRVDASWDDAKPGISIPASSGPDRGHHDVCAIATFNDSVLIVNSWGPEWADRGFAWLSRARIEEASTRDVLVTTCAPLLAA